MGRENLDKAVARLESGQRGNISDLNDVARLAQSASASFEQVGQRVQNIVRQVTTELVTATRPYFAGNYAAAKAALDSLNYPDGRFKAQLRLFRAATTYSLYALDGERNEALRRDAEANIREYRRLTPSAPAPDPSAFSLRFIQFFNSTR